jgi:hypothetical protein
MSTISPYTFLPPVSHCYVWQRQRELTSIRTLEAVSVVVPANDFALSPQNASQEFYNICEILDLLLLFKFEITNLWVVNYFLYFIFPQETMERLHLSLLDCDRSCVTIELYSIRPYLLT